ncbi:MAG TPA: ATP-binding protein [Methylomirabilota bacterium]|nr:ATP-binding protein [Methylomirabilota bacterium]
MARPGPATSAVVRHLQVLRSVTEAVSRSLDLEEVLDRSLDALTQVTGHEISSLHLVSPDGETLLLRGERGMSPRLREVNLVLPMGVGLIGSVARSGQPRRVDDVGRARDLLPAAREAVVADGIRAFVCVPIRARQRLLGTLSLGRSAGSRFTDGELSLLECVSDQIGLALDNARLYSETRHQLTELERARTAAVRAERMSAIDGLAAGVAHEINNPLTIILGQIHVMLQGDPGEELQSQLGVIDGAARRAAKIVKDLRSFAEPAPAQRAPVSVSALVRQVLDANASRLRADHVEWRTALEEVPTIWADAAQLEQVLQSLIDNARFAMAAAHQGGMLTLRLMPISAGIRIEVADDGPGIAPNHLPRIFNPFFTTKGPDQGRGLGLAVAHGIIKEHGGRLWAENAESGGAVLMLELPVSLRRTERAAS